MKWSFDYLMRFATFKFLQNDVFWILMIFFYYILGRNSGRWWYLQTSDATIRVEKVKWSNETGILNNTINQSFKISWVIIS